MSTRIHTRIATPIVAALVISAVAAPGTIAGRSMVSPTTIPPSLARLHEPGSTGYVPMSPRAPSIAAPKVDPLAVSYLLGKGLSPGQVQSWTVGACSHRVKDASCYAMFPSQLVSAQVVPSTGFQWADAGIGAGFTVGIVLILAGAGLLISRQSRREQSVHA